MAEARTSPSAGTTSGAALDEAERALAKASTIPEKLVAELKKHGTNLRRLEGINRDGNAVLAAGVTIDVARKNALSVVRTMQKSAGPDYFAFISEQNFGVGGRLDNVSLLRAADPYEAMRIMGTNADNYDMDPQEVIERLKKWDAAFGLTFHGVGYDWVEAQFQRQPPNMSAFAKGVYAFCPDVVDQGAGSVKKLADEMARTNTLYLWWD